MPNVPNPETKPKCSGVHAAPFMTGDIHANVDGFRPLVDLHQNLASVSAISQIELIQNHECFSPEEKCRLTQAVLDAVDLAQPGWLR